MTPKPLAGKVEKKAPWWQSSSGDCLHFDPMFDNELTCSNCLRWRGLHPHHEVIRLQGIIAEQLRQALADIEHWNSDEPESPR